MFHMKKREEKASFWCKIFSSAMSFLLPSDMSFPYATTRAILWAPALPLATIGQTYKYQGHMRQPNSVTEKELGKSLKGCTLPWQTFRDRENIDILSKDVKCDYFLIMLYTFIYFTVLFFSFVENLYICQPLIVLLLQSASFQGIFRQNIAFI